LSQTRYWTLTVIAAASFVAMLVNIGFGVANGNARTDVNQRQQFVQQSVQLEGLYKDIVRSLAELGARNNDGDVKALLQKHGITYNVNPPAATPAPAAAPARK
jgi:hypothetical protein